MPSHHVHGRRLPRPVRAEEAEELALLHREGDAAHRFDLAGVGFFQVRDFNDVLGHEV
jgi:hypothetical protein